MLAAGITLPVIVLLLRLGLGIETPGSGGDRDIGTTVTEGLRLILALLVPTPDTWLSLGLFVALLGLGMVFTLFHAKRWIANFDRNAPEVQMWIFSVLLMGAIGAVLTISGQFALRSVYVLVVPSVFVIATTAFLLPVGSMLRSVFSLAFPLLFSAMFFYSLQTWQGCDRIWKDINGYLAEAGDGAIVLERRDVFFRRTHLAAQPSCLMRYTLYPMAKLDERVTVENPGEQSLSVDEASVVWNAERRSISFERW